MRAMKRFAFLTMLLPVLLLAGCAQIWNADDLVDTAASGDVAASGDAVALVDASIAVETLMNATYSGIYDEPITLTEGLFEGEATGVDDPAQPTVEYIQGAELAGDLDGDGVDDAVVFLLERGGGSGAFTYVAAQLNRDGQPVDAGAVWIEDRIGVRSAAIEDGQVMLDLILQGPGDVACCGSHKARRTYALQEGQLVDTTGDNSDLVKVSAADLDNTSWTLAELNNDQPAPAETGVTIRFQDGQITGFGGCNSYTGNFSLGDDNPFVMTINVMTNGPVAATRQSCPDPVAAQESAYLAALQSVSQWNYLFGKLGLYYADEQGEFGRLLFAPAGAKDVAEVDDYEADYEAASALTRNGFAKDDDEIRQLDGQEVMLWGYVDHGNLYGDESAQEILGDWWSGAGPDASTWRFNLKAQADDAVGDSFAVTVSADQRRDEGRDELLRQFVTDAEAGRPTRVFVTGRLATFEAPSSDRVRTGLTMDVQSSSDISIAE